MAGGFLAGLAAGTVVSGLALGAVSVAVAPAGRVPARVPDAAAVDLPAGSGFKQSRDDTAARLPKADDALALEGQAPQVSDAQPDDLSQLATADTAPTSRPEISAPQAEMAAPEVTDEGSGMTMVGDAPAEPAAPDIGDDLAISSDPAQPSAPDVEGDVGLDTVQDPEQTPAPSDDGENASAAVPISGDMAEQEAARTGVIGNIAAGVETQRLPSLAAGPATPDPVPAEDAVPAQSAIIAHAATFDNPEGKPLMSIVLIDDGTSPIGLEALEAFPYPLSFAVDAAWPSAAEAMRRYRDAGFEVLAIADLPAGADARDTETTMQTVEAAVPEAVAILEGTGAGLQISRESSEQLAPILLASGRGLVLYSKGLETAPKLIAREGVPVATIFRDFDAKDQSATVIRRFLDQAAFKAGRDEGGVIMLGRLRADTISALLLWGLQDRASRVALAPVSAVLTARD
ncbi:divergent polysaccharide deacteylase family protein [Roseovarius dicentrarchi]|uniref:divergent polysaccharide deacteylase family protein n=1 Tax=Roseovarius dicentrarchi TaxID=2250573 RepID=UPI000DE9994B|nr:divergent polysaccharide deacteylase family protein [Roseovarius dicentrarchi]